MYMFTCVCWEEMRECSRSYMCIQETRGWLWNVFLISLFFLTVSLSKFEAHHVDQTVWPVIPWVLALALGLQACPIIPDFSVGIGIWTLVLMLAKQMLYPLSHLPSPRGGSQTAAIQVWWLVRNKNISICNPRDEIRKLKYLSCHSHFTVYLSVCSHPQDFTV